MRAGPPADHGSSQEHPRHGRAPSREGLCSLRARLSHPAPPVRPSAAPGVGKTFGPVSVGLPTCAWRLPVACKLSEQGRRGSLAPWRDEAWLCLLCGAACGSLRPTCGQEEEEAWDGGGCLGTTAPTVPASLAPGQLCAAASHQRPLPPAPSLTWLLFRRLSSPLLGWEWAFASLSMGVLGIVAADLPRAGTQGRCCLLREVLSWEWVSPGSRSLYAPTVTVGTPVTMAGGHHEAPAS